TATPTRSGSTACASRRPSCGGRTPTRARKCPSTPSSPTLSPFEAQAYALCEALGLRAGDDPVATVEAFLAREGLGEALAAHGAAWRRADARTPHGVPIELIDADFTAAAAPSPRSP